MDELLPPGACQVWWAPVPADAGALEGLLDARERRRAARLAHPPARAAYVLAHAVARLVTARLTGLGPAEVEFTAECRHCAGPHGRPRVAGTPIWVSLSHCTGRAAVAVARDQPIGVDVEQVALRGRAIPVSALSAAERVALAAIPEPDRLSGFITYWTRKEAALKATGDGVVIGPAKLTVSPPGDSPTILDWADRPLPHPPVHLTDLSPGPGYHASLATLGSPLRVTEHEAAPLLTGLH